MVFRERVTGTLENSWNVSIELTMIENAIRRRTKPFNAFPRYSHGPTIVPCYRALMRVQNAEARAFYEQEIVDCGWNKVQHHDTKRMLINGRKEKLF
jgi:hypothetical protein